jgi:hypothetical protein
LELRPKPGRNNNKSKTFLKERVGLAVVANDLNLLPNEQKGTQGRPMNLK